MSGVHRAVVEENRRVLLRRRMWALQNGNSTRVPMPSDLTAVLSNMTTAEVELAADSAHPICQLAVDEIALANLAKSGETLPISANDDAVSLLAQENEDVLFARWAAARQDDIKAQMVYSLPAGTVGWLKSATLADIRTVAGTGHPCVRLSVRPAALWQSGKGPHLSQVQRTALHIVSQKVPR